MLLQSVPWAHLSPSNLLTWGPAAGASSYNVLNAGTVIASGITGTSYQIQPQVSLLDRLIGLNSAYAAGGYAVQAVDSSGNTSTPTAAVLTASGSLNASVGQYAVLSAGISGTSAPVTQFSTPGAFGNVTISINQGQDYYFPIPVTLSTDAQSYLLTLQATPFGSMPDDFGQTGGTSYSLLPASAAGDNTASASGNLTLANLQNNGSLTLSDYLSAPAAGLDMVHSPYTLASTAYHGKIDTNSDYLNTVQMIPQMKLHIGQDVLAGNYTSTAALTLAPVYAQ